MKVQAAVLGVCLLPLSLAAQGSTTNCYGIGNSVRCRTESDPPPPLSFASSFLKAYAAAAQASREREALELKQAEAVAESERNRAISDARQELFLERARMVLGQALDSLSFVDSVAVDAQADLIRRLELLYRADPTASTSRMRDEIEPVVVQWKAKDRTFFQSAIAEYRALTSALALPDPAADSLARATMQYVFALRARSLTWTPEQIRIALAIPIDSAVAARQVARPVGKRADEPIPPAPAASSSPGKAAPPRQALPAGREREPANAPMIITKPNGKPIRSNP